MRSAMLTIEDVATLLNCSKMTVYRRCKDGTLPVLRLGRMYRFRPEDIEAFIESGRQIA